MAIYDPTITNTINPNLQSTAHNQGVTSWRDFEYENNTSSRTLSYELGTIDIESKLESNTSLIGYNENRTSLEPAKERPATWTETIKPTMEALIFLAERLAERMKPTNEALNFIGERITERMKPTMEALKYIAARLAERIEPIIKSFEHISIYRKDIDVIHFENIGEPIDFHIKTNVKDDLIIDSIEDTKALLDDLKNVKVDKVLSKYFTKRLNE